ncbi:MAG: cyclic-di-AMP receptor [Oscillospiraceae bacterium]|jgi:uncharacterized protein YaaQ|nr:cyclic-di-AMP receptor [Oscillospiraceae bacterium]
MKLLIAVINKEDAGHVTDELTAAGMGLTKLSTSGGFLRAGNITIMAGIDDEKINDALEIIKNNSQKRIVDTPVTVTDFANDVYLPQNTQITVGGATVFVLDVDKFYKL